MSEDMGRQSGVAIVVVDNPPVNALNLAAREKLYADLAAAIDKKGIDVCVIRCAGTTFVAGADIGEFGTPKSGAFPTIRDIITLIESSSKPVIAAMHGMAFGGGLELALGCHYRVATQDAKLALPEVKLGLLPGAGGTVRLPRLAGPLKALSMIVSGNPIGAQEALEAGILDATFEGDLSEGSAAFARRVAADGSASPRVRDHDEKLGMSRADLQEFEALAAKELRRSANLDAPAACVQAVRNAILLPFDDALAQERNLFQGLLEGDQARAQQYLFFAERKATKRSGDRVTEGIAKIRSVGIVGAGTMGGGIAMAFANVGIPVTVVDRDNPSLQRGFAVIERNYEVSVSRGSISREEKANRLTRVHRSTDLQALEQCDLIIEAVFEDIHLKKEVLHQLSKIANPKALIATNTSYLDVDDLASATIRPEQFLGMHFFSPANVMKLVEVVRGARTSSSTMDKIVDVSKVLGKVPVVVGNCYGFVGNRMLDARSKELESLLLAGATPSQVDRVYTDFGFPMGPFQMFDLAGIDLGWRRRQALGRTAVIADHLYGLGRYGQKSNRGFYRYQNGRNPEVDEEVENIIKTKAAELGITRHPVSAREIIERTLYPMVNEGARILDEGIADRASDIDIIWVYGYGFPRGKGGPMFWAGLEGLSTITGALVRWFERSGNELYRPSPFLQALADRDSRF